MKWILDNLLEIVELLAAFVVALGCAGEFWIIINKLTLHNEPAPKSASWFWRKLHWMDARARPILVRLKVNGRTIPEWKEDLLERMFVIMVALGVSIEFVCLPFSMLEIAQLNKETEGLRSANILLRAALEEKIIASEKRAMSKTPGQLPVFSVSAFARIDIATNSISTNRWGNGNTGWTAFLFFTGTNGTQFARSPSLRMVSGDLTWFGGGAEATVITIPVEFRWAAGVLSGLPPLEMTADDLVNRLKYFEIHPAFLLNGTRVIGGSIVLILNSAVYKTFPIPPQTYAVLRTNATTGEFEGSSVIRNF